MHIQYVRIQEASHGMLQYRARETNVCMECLSWDFTFTSWLSSIYRASSVYCAGKIGCDEKKLIRVVHECCGILSLKHTHMCASLRQCVLHAYKCMNMLWHIKYIRTMPVQFVGWTALHFAVAYGELGSTQELLRVTPKHIIQCVAERRPARFRTMIDMNEVKKILLYFGFKPYTCIVLDCVCMHACMNMSVKKHMHTVFINPKRNGWIDIATNPRPLSYNVSILTHDMTLLSCISCQKIVFIASRSRAAIWTCCCSLSWSNIDTWLHVMFICAYIVHVMFLYSILP